MVNPLDLFVDPDAMRVLAVALGPAAVFYAPTRRILALVAEARAEVAAEQAASAGQGAPDAAASSVAKA